MKLRMIFFTMLSTLLLIAGPLAADDSPAKEIDKKAVYRKAILAHAKLDINVFKEQLKGGLADGKQVTDFPMEQLIEGIETEMEHTDNPMLALEIAMDHLVELNDYYTRLEIMEHGHGKKMAGGMHHRGMMDKKRHSGNCCAMKGHKTGTEHKCTGHGKMTAGKHKCAMQAGAGNKTTGGEHKCSETCAGKKAGGESASACKTKATTEDKPATK